MSEKLAVKHQNSLPLTKHKLLQQENGTKRCCSCSKPYKRAIFCIITCCIFVLYWIILTPLLISHPNNSTRNDQWSAIWFILYWFLAFLVWLFIMLFMILIWKCITDKHDDDVKLQSYGTNGSPKLAYLTDSVKLNDIRRDDEHLDDLRSDETKTVREKQDTNIVHEPRNKINKHKDLPPLVIHRRNLGNDIECAGTVSIEENDDENDEDKSILRSEVDSQKSQRESMKSYLKLVTVTPQDETDTKSPEALLSPRELFFIDLIREAEKAEQNKDNNPAERKHFFPNDFLLTEKDVVTRDLNERKNSTETEKRETTYFIANIESPRSEKAEVFLEIKPDSEVDKQWNVNLNEEKPVLTLKDNVKNKNTEEKVVLFEA